MTYILLIIAIVVIVADLVVSTKKYRLENALHKLERSDRSGIYRKVELALRDFIIAYDDQEPEKLLSAYNGTLEAIEFIEQTRERLELPFLL